MSFAQVNMTHCRGFEGIIGGQSGQTKRTVRPYGTATRALEVAITVGAWITENWLSLWGAGLSTTLATIRLVEFRADQGRLHLELLWLPGDAGQDGLVRPSWSAAIPMLKATNRGRRTVHVTAVGAHRSSGQKVMDARLDGIRGVPAVLDEGASVIIGGGRFSDWIIDLDVRAVVVSDSLGRSWQTTKAALEEFRRVGRPLDPD